MTLTTARTSYMPILYPEADSFWELQHSVHWLPNEIPMGVDVNDWKRKLTKEEKYLVEQILKGFVASEIFIEDYWSSKVGRWFKHPEIQRMAATFAAFESIHQKAYARINEELGILDFDAFLKEPSAKAKIDRLIEIKGKSKSEIALSLAVFSAFNEGVNLFSSFSILMSFQNRNLLKGVGKIVEWSIRDEELHSKAGCWLFRQLIEEFPEIWTDELKKSIYDAARLTVELEDLFINNAFKLGDIEGITEKEIKNFIRYRTNYKLQELGLKSNWKNIDKQLLEKMEWFNVLCGGVQQQDFFAQRTSDYSRGVITFDNIWEINNNE